MDQRSKHCSQQSAIRCFSYYLGLHIGDFIHESPLPVYQLLGSNSATADTFAFTPFWQTWLLSQCRTTLGGFLTCAVTLLTLRLGSSRYANGDGERVLSQQQADKACGVWRGAASGTSPPRYTHPGPRLILLLPACRSAPAHSPTGARPKKKSQTLRTAANPSNVISLWLFFLSSHFTFKKKKYKLWGLAAQRPKSKESRAVIPRDRNPVVLPEYQPRLLGIRDLRSLPSSRSPKLQWDITQPTQPHGNSAALVAVINSSNLHPV